MTADAMPTALPPAAVRAFRPDDDADWWAVRDLLVRSHRDSPPAWNWDVRRWDGSRFHSEVPRLADAIAAGIGLWETADGRLVGVTHAEYAGGEAFVELDPDYRHLQPTMLDWVETRLARTAGGRRVAEVWAWDYDLPRRELLAARGYEEQASGGWVRLLRFGGWPIPEPEVDAGYRARATSAATLDGDAARMADLLNAAFGRSIHTAAEYRTFATLSPSFRHDLNLVAEAPDGSFAAHVGLTLDEANRHGIIEPVCTHPDHRRHGLALALLYEGLRRLRAAGAATAAVETGEMEPANALYRSVGFGEEYHGHRWRKDLGPA